MLWLYGVMTRKKKKLESLVQCLMNGLRKSSQIDVSSLSRFGFCLLVNRVKNNDQNTVTFIIRWKSVAEIPTVFHSPTSG